MVQESHKDCNSTEYEDDCTLVRNVLGKVVKCGMVKGFRTKQRDLHTVEACNGQREHEREKKTIAVIQLGHEQHGTARFYEFVCHHSNAKQGLPSADLQESLSYKR